MFKVRHFILFLAGLTIGFSCKKEFSYVNPLGPLNEAAINDAETVIASISGMVVNEKNIPIQGATVKSGTQITTTNMYGSFVFRNIAISKNNGFVKVSMPGYFNGNRSFITTAGRTHNVRIKLLPKTNAGSINGTTGGNITIAGGGKLSLPAGAVMDAAGTAYGGMVNVAMTWINPVADDLGSTIPGDLRGVSATNTERVLETYGMLGVELTSTGGQELKIATGKTAELSFPIPAALQATAPASIPLWHFDENAGRWKEEGSATKIGANYIGSVAHFSFWNCDFPAPTINLCVQVSNSNNQPLNNVIVRIRRVNNNASTGYGHTDSLGNVCGAVPKNEPLILEILNNCGVVVYSQNIGPYTANASVNVVANILPINYISITGNVLNCTGTPVVNGSVYIYISGGNQYSVPVTNGSFSTQIFNCAGTAINYSIIGIDNQTLQQGNPVSGTASSGSINLGTLTACGTNAAEFVNLLVDGSPFNWNIPADSITGNPQTPSSGYGFGVSILANNANGSGTSFPGCYLYIDYNSGPGPGHFGGGLLNTPPLGISQMIVSAGTTMITEVGATNTGFIAGNIANASFDYSGTIRTVNGIFRVRRR